jgi:hypothetical protein
MGPFGLKKGGYYDKIKGVKALFKPAFKGLLA